MLYILFNLFFQLKLYFGYFPFSLHEDLYFLNNACVVGLLNHFPTNGSQSHCQASPGIQNEINASYQCFFPNGSDDKDSVCNAGDLGSIPGLRRFPGEGNGYPLQYSCLKISMDREAW